jgi:hypothetical protein
MVAKVLDTLALEQIFELLKVGLSCHTVPPQFHAVPKTGRDDFGFWSRFPIKKDAELSKRVQGNCFVF